MVINGNLTIHTLGSGEFRNAIIERLTTTNRNAATHAAGRIVFDTTLGTYYYSDGSAWVAFATGGNATALQTEVNAIESTLGTLVNTDGTTNVATALSNSYFGGATNLTTALQNLASAVTGKDALSELLDVGSTFTPANTGVLYFNSAATNNNATTGAWLTAVPGATSGVQAYDAGLTSIAGLTTSADTMIYTTALDTYAVTTLTSFARTLLDDSDASTMRSTLGVVIGTDVQAHDAALDALSAVSGTGFLVQTGVDTFITTTLAVDGTGNKAGLTIADASGLGDAPTIGLNINGMTAEAGTPSGTDTLPMFDGVNNVKVSVTQLKEGIVASGITLVNLSDVNNSSAGPATPGTYILRADNTEWHVESLELNDIMDVASTNGSTASNAVNVFVGDGVGGFDVETLTAGTALTFDTTGVAVVLNVDDVFLSNTGDTLASGSLTIASSASIVVSSGADITAVDAPVNANDLTNKAYVDALVAAGASWKNPVVDSDLVDVVGVNPATPESTYGLGVGANVSFIATASFTFSLGTGTTVAAVAGNVVNLTITSTGNGDYTLVNVGLTTGDRFILGAEHGSAAGITAGTLGSLEVGTPSVSLRKGDLIEFSGTGNGSAVGSWLVPDGRGGNAVNKIATLSTLVGGASYTNGSYTNVALTGGTGVGARANITVAGNAVTVVTLVKGGTGYTVSNTLSANAADIGGTGSGFSINVATLGTNPTEIAQGVTVLDADPESVHYGHTYLYNAAGNVWVEIAGPGAVGAGTGLYYVGNTLNIGLGAGIKELPTDEIGLDLVSGLALQLTGVATADQLTFVLEGATLSQSTSGLKIAATGVTSVELASSVAGLGIAGGAGTALSFAPVELTDTAVTTSDHIVLSDTSAADAPIKRNIAAFLTDLNLVTFGGLSATDGVKYTSGTGVFELDITTLGTAVLATGDELVFNDVSNSGTHIKRTITNFLADMDIVNTLGANGIAVQTAADTYTARSVVASAVAAKLGINVVNGDGVSGNITVGLDINGLTNSLINTTLAATDLFAVYDVSTTENKKITANNLANFIGAATNLAELSDVNASVDGGTNTAGQILVATGSDYANKTVQFIYQATGVAQTSYTITHGLNQQFVNVTILDASDNSVIIPESIIFTSSTVTTVTVNSAILIKAVIMGVPGVAVTTVNFA